MLPKITELEFNIQAQEETVQSLGKSFLFDFVTGEFVKQDGKLVRVSGKEAIKVWIEKQLRTEFDRYKVYEGTNYGLKTDDLIGHVYPLPFIESELRRELTEKLTTHPEISGMSNFTVVRTKKGLDVTFKVDLISNETFEQEVSIGV